MMAMIETPGLDDGIAIRNMAMEIDIFSPEDVACVEMVWHIWCEKSQENELIFLVYRDGGQILGFICYEQRIPTVGTFDVLWLAVAQSAHGRGIGRALIRHMEEDVLARGGYLALAETSGRPDYEGTRRFYESCGYEVSGRVKDFYRRGDDMVLFAHYLS